MTLPMLVFLPGTHGNFLTRILTVASGTIQDFDFFGSKLGAHNNQNDFHKQKIVEYIHPPQYWEKGKKDDVFVYISINQSDLYLLCWHVVFAGGEFGLDLLQLKDFDDIEKILNQIALDRGDKIRKQIPIFKNDGSQGLRELIKTLFKDTKKSNFDQQENILNRCNVKNIFKFVWFYDKQIFCKQVEKILIELGYEYKVDISHHQQVFIDRKQNIIESKKLVEHAFNCYTTNTSMDISNFCIYEQAYLDYLIEQHLGYEIENWQTYPSDTRDINPTEAWEGVRYEL